MNKSEVIESAETHLVSLSCLFAVHLRWSETKASSNLAIESKDAGEDGTDLGG